jgi:hypothetical protein
MNCGLELGMWITDGGGQKQIYITYAIFFHSWEELEMDYVYNLGHHVWYVSYASNQVRVRLLHLRSYQECDD